jgi:hypothetical protein
VLNEDFSSTNPDYSSIPSVFQGVASGDVTVRFVWILQQEQQENL